MPTSSLRRATLALTAVILGACGSSAIAGGPAPSAPPGGAVITAANTSFDRAQLTVPADREFPLLFENRESVPHNVSVVDATSGDPWFTGEIFGGMASRTYAVPAIPPGTYRFLCDVHPTMVGTLIATVSEGFAEPGPAPILAAQ